MPMKFGESSTNLTLKSEPLRDPCLHSQEGLATSSSLLKIHTKHQHKNMRTNQGIRHENDNDLFSMKLSSIWARHPPL